MKSGRPREFDEEGTLSRVMHSFWQHGFQDTTFEQLVTDSGLSRSSLYNSFGGKEALFEQAIALYINQQFTQLRDTLEDEAAGADALQQFVERIGTPYDPCTKDCLLRKTALHNAGSAKTPKEGAQLGSYLRDLWKALVCALSNLKHKKPTPLTIDERSALLVAAFFGSAVISRNGSNQALLKAIADGTAKIIQQQD